MYNYGPAILEAIRSTQVFGYNEAKQSIKNGTYVSPKKLFEDTKHKLSYEFFDYEQFKIGVLKALEEKHHNDKIRRNSKVKETIQKVIEELDRG